MNDRIPTTEAKAGACAYILHGLLQRLEADHPGLVLSLLQGVEGDRAAVKTNGAMSEPLEAVFQETKRILELVHAQNQMGPTDGSA